MNANLILILAAMAAILGVAVATLVVATVMIARIARRHAAPEPEPRTIATAVADSHNGLDGFLVRTIDAVGAALAAAVPAPVQVMACTGAAPGGGAPAAPSSAPTLGGATAAVETAAAALAQARAAIIAAAG